MRRISVDRLQSNKIYQSILKSDWTMINRVYLEGSRGNLDNSIKRLSV